jgi:hypothetical protein
MGRPSSHVHLAIGLSLIGYRDLAIELLLSSHRGLSTIERSGYRGYRAIGPSMIGPSRYRAIDDRAIALSAIALSAERPAVVCNCFV